MRFVPLSVCLTILASAASAQVQERKLVDRLLRPDMSLVNSAQDKKFVAAEKSSFDRKFDTKVFQTGDQHITKSFLGIREFFARKFESKKSSHSETTAVIHGESRYTGTEFGTRESSPSATAIYAENKITAHQYSEGERSFLAEGTRQKILSQQDHPLTIEEVRDLLNRTQ